MRWRRFVLTHVVAQHDVDPADSPDLADRALAIAAHYGLTPESLTAEQAGYWLTAAEATELPDKEKMLRVLVRSYRPPCPTSDLDTAEAGLATAPRVRRAVAEAHVINAEVASWASGQSIDQLKPA